MNALLRDVDRAREEAAQRDIERLQGGWRFIAGQREASLTVSGNQFTMRFRNGDLYEGTFSVDPTCRPRAMDLNIDLGPDEHRGKLVVAIYQFDGDHLIWSPAPPGRDERPSAFPPTDDAHNLCLIFRRA